MVSKPIEVSEIHLEIEKPTPPKPFIGAFSDQSQWQKEVSSPHISIGYRIHFNTPKLCINSVFKLHNETMNIWTHLLAFLLAVYIAIVKCQP